MGTNGKIEGVKGYGMPELEISSGGHLRGHSAIPEGDVGSCGGRRKSGSLSQRFIADSNPPPGNRRWNPCPDKKSLVAETEKTDCSSVGREK